MKREKRNPTIAAWIIGVIVFVLAMGITFSDVYGLDRFEYTRPGGGSTTPSLAYAPASLNTASETVGVDCSSNVAMPAVPEPLTIWLVALGGGMILARRRK